MYVEWKYVECRMEVCRMEVLHSLLSDKWSRGQETGFTTMKECIVKRINIA